MKLRQDRGKLDDTLSAMFSNPLYSHDYLYYAHMIGMCRIIIDDNMKATAGVNFMHDHYNLYIKPNSEWVPFDAIKDNIDPASMADALKNTQKQNGILMYQSVIGFDDLSLLERLAVLKHEMLHILYHHIQRQGDRDHKLWNYATDCALNQHIKKEHLPEWVILPKKMEKLTNCAVKENESSEFYYDLFKEEMKNQNKNGQGKSQGESSESNESGDGDPSDRWKNFDPNQMFPGEPQLDDHDVWSNSEGDKTIQKDLTSKMIEKARDETIRQAHGGPGAVPQQISDWLKLMSTKSEVNWKKVLRGIVGNKRVGRRSTIMRQDRRFPKREDLRGKTRDRMFNLLVVADVSGSMSDKALLETLSEVRNICDLTKTDVDLIQIDTQAYPPEKLTKKSKLIERKGNGGTYLNRALEMADKHNIDYQAIVVLTDGGLFGDDVPYFERTGKKVIWLIESTGQILDSMNTSRMRAFKLKASKTK